MKKVLILIIILLPFIIIPQENENLISGYEYIKYMYFPRDEGTENEKKLINYLEQHCTKNNLEYKINPINDEKDIITNSYNFEIYLKGSGKKQEQLIIVCPINSAIIKQEFHDNSISIQILLDLINKCNGIDFKKDIIFLFTGSIESENSNYYGIKYFFENNENTENSFVTVINLLSNKEKIQFSGSINNKPIPLKLLKMFYKTDYKKSNIYFSRDEIYRAKFHVQHQDNCLSYLLKENINAVSFSNKNRDANKPFTYDAEYQKKLTEYFYNWILMFDKEKLVFDYDYHYLLIEIFGLKIFLSEFFIIIIYLISFLIAIIIRFLLPNFRRFHLNLLFRTLPYFIIIFMTFFLSSFIPLLIFMPISLFFGTFKPYISSSLIYFINIFLVPLMIIYMLFESLKKLPFPKHSFLYVFGAFVFSFLNFILFLIIDISIAHIYLWAMFIITISQFTGRNFKIKFLLYAITPIPFIFLLKDIAFAENIAIVKNTNPILLNLVFSILTYPFILLLLRVISLTAIKERKILKRSIIFINMGIIITVSIFLFIILSMIKLPGNKQLNANLNSYIKNKISYLSLNSNMNIGEVYIQDSFKGANYYIKKKNKKFFLSKADEPYVFDYWMKEPDSYWYYFRIKSDRMIEYVKIYLVAPFDQYPLASNYNYKKIDKYKNMTEFNKEIFMFNPGRNPGKDFLFELTLVPGKYKIFFEIEYPFIDEKTVIVRKPDAFVNYKSTYIQEVNIPIEINK